MGIEVPLFGMGFAIVRIAIGLAILYMLWRGLANAVATQDANDSDHAALLSRRSKRWFGSAAMSFLIVIVASMSGGPKLAIHSEAPSEYNRPAVSTEMKEGNKSPEFLPGFQSLKERMEN